MSVDLLLIGIDEKIETAYARMKSHGLRHLPVRGENGAIIGMLSDRDVQRAMISEIDRDSSGLRSFEMVSFDPESRVRDYMSWPVLTVDHEADLLQVVSLILENHVSALVVQVGDRAVGIITTDDLLRVLAQYLAEGNGPKWSIRSVIDRSMNTFESTLI